MKSLIHFFYSNSTNLDLREINLQDYNIQEQIVKTRALNVFFERNMLAPAKIKEHQLNYFIENSLPPGETFTNDILFSVYDSRNNLPIKTKQWDFLLQRTDLNYTNFEGYNFLLYVLNNFDPKVLTPQQYNWIVEQSNLTQLSERQDCILSLIIEHNINTDMFTPESLNRILYNNLLSTNCFLSSHMVLEDKLQEGSSHNLHFIFDYISQKENYLNKLNKYGFKHIIEYNQLYQEKKIIDCSITSKISKSLPFKL